MAEPQIRPRSPEPSRVPVRTWPTPNTTDLLFYVERDGNLPINQCAPGAKSWAYGDPYFDRVNYPNHKLVYVSPQSPEQWSRWYYAADRTHQDDYNFSWSSTDIGGTRFQTVVRTYLTLRSQFVAGTPKIGTPMELVPATVFGEYQAGDFVLASTKQVRTETELDSLYVAEERVFVRRCTITELPFDEATSAILSSTDTLYFGTEVVTGMLTAAALFADRANAFWGTSATGYVTDGRQLTCDWYLITTKEVVPPNEAVEINGSSATAIPIRTYGGSETFM